jgi:ceramide glucosyltransferase
VRLISLLFLPAIAYQGLALFAGASHLYKRRRVRHHHSTAKFQPGVSVLKPVRGLDPNTYEAFVSQAKQNYPSFEILFGVQDRRDPIIPLIQQLQQEFSDVSIRLIVSDKSAPNGKVSTLMELAAHARYPVWVVNDGDIKVTPEYLNSVVAPLQDEQVGVVTCPYRAEPHTLPAAWEALGISTDFMPSTLVAPLVGVREFGLGSTLAFRSRDLEQAGGFRALREYLADDYQLAKRITGLGKRALLSTYTVETALSEATWRGVWQHQLRWGTTVRSSKGGGYIGLPLTHAGVWAILAAACGASGPLVALLAARVLSGFLTGGFVLQSRFAMMFCWLAPAWDLYAFAVWIASYSSREVRWRDHVLTVDSVGRILRCATQGTTQETVQDTATEPRPC